MTARTLFVRGSLTLALAIVPAWCFAAKPAAKTASMSRQPDQESMDLFEAIDAGLVDVKFIPKNEKQARLRIKNRSGKPLSVRLPEAFGARPVLAQVGGPLPAGVLNGAGANNGQNGAAQNLGSTFGGQNGRQGLFNVPADKPADLRVTCVCLQYGKPTPRPAIPYEMVRLDAVSKEPSLAGLLSRLETSNQRQVQAAAWHVASGMSWKELAAVHVEHLVEANEPFFTASDLKEAKDLLGEVTADAKDRESQSNSSASAAASFSASAP